MRSECFDRFSAVPSLQIFADFLRRPIGWIAAAALFVVNFFLLHLVGNFVSGFGEAAYSMFGDSLVLGMIASSLLGDALAIGLYAAFIFPVARIVLRSSLDLEPPRWLAWLFVAIAEALVISGAVMVLSIAAYLIIPDAMASQVGQWREYIFRAIISPLFLGLFVWKIALVCGNKTTRLSTVHRFVWQELGGMVAVYFAVLLFGLLLLLGISFAASGMSEIAFKLARAAQGALLTWLIGLLVAAIYLDFSRSDHPIESVFA